MISVFRVRYDKGSIAPHRHERARIAMLLDGSVAEETNGRIVDIRKHQLVFWPEGVTHSNVFGRASQSLQIELSHEIYRHVARWFPPPPSPIDSDRFEGATQRLLREVDRYDAASPMALQSAIYEIVARASRLTSSQEPLSFAVTQAIRFANASIADPIAIGDLAEAANVSVRSLHERFTEELGTTPMDYVRDLRLTHAESLLRETQLPAAEIAAACGFYDQAHFCRLFKQRTGTTPRQFRTQNAGAPS
ncbi:MAG TPA: AraC family transcriptional regulator [Thermoanaerobaculia bacterium]|nr:AraC family transcriptional regulator [Thermoanaerobaculia bacterium]